MITRPVRKYHVGGLGTLDDPRIPQVPLELYIRSALGETFHVATLEEGISHLLSTEGYRLTIREWPDGPGFTRDSFAVQIRRFGNKLVASIQAPWVAVDSQPGTIKWDFTPWPPLEEQGTIEVISLEEVLGLPPRPESPEEEVEIVEVSITGE